MPPPNPKLFAGWFCVAKPFAAAGVLKPAVLSWNGCAACKTAGQMPRLEAMGKPARCSLSSLCGYTTTCIRLLHPVIDQRHLQACGCGLRSRRASAESKASGRAAGIGLCRRALTEKWLLLLLRGLLGIK